MDHIFGYIKNHNRLSKIFSWNKKIVKTFSYHEQEQQPNRKIFKTCPYNEKLHDNKISKQRTSFYADEILSSAESRKHNSLKQIIRSNSCEILATNPG